MASSHLSAASRVSWSPPACSAETAREAVGWMGLERSVLASHPVAVAPDAAPGSLATAKMFR